MNALINISAQVNNRQLIQFKKKNLNLEICKN